MVRDPEPQPPLVLHVVHRFAVGGLENGVVNLVNRMPRDAWRHGIVALTDVSASFRARIRRDDVPCYSLHKGPGHGVALYPRLARLFRTLRPAIVHTRNLAALEAVVPAWAARVPVRVHGEHGRDMHDLDGASRKYQLVRRIYRPFVTQYVALSHDLERYLAERVRIPARRIEHLWNGVDTERFRPARGVRVALAGSPFNDPRFWVAGTVGRLEPVKDQTNLVRAFVRALALEPAAAARLRLIVVGDGALRAEAEGIVRAARRESHVWFAGERSDVPEVMRALDCFVLPSLAEGISNTVLEAMASGLPVIATRVGANAELMEEGLSGRLVPRADFESLAAALLDYFHDPAKARMHGRAGRQIVERRFSLERMVDDYDRLYRRLLVRHGIAGASIVPAPRRGAVRH